MMSSRFPSLFLAAAVVIVAIITACSDNATDPFHTPPTLVREYAPVSDGGDTLHPLTLQWFQDTLFVSYAGRPRLDLYSGELELLRTVALTDRDTVIPSSFAVSDSMIIVTDHARGLVILYDRGGRVIGSFGTLPDGVTPLYPFCVTEYQDVAYIGDVGSQKVLAVSLSDRGGVTERGELVLTIPPDSVHQVKFASALVVTPDGRLLVGDAGAGDVKVFTCDGRFVYRFDSIPTTGGKPAPMAFTIDDIIDPSLQDTTSFDPSGVRLLGRIFVADGNNGQLHVFNPLGHYVFSFGAAFAFERPTGLAFDRGRGMLYVADAGTGRIYQFQVEEAI